MRNIIIVTWTGVWNYGTALQSYALQFAIEKLGYNVRILDKITNVSVFGRFIRYYRNFISLFFGGKNTKKEKMNTFHHNFQKIIRPRTMKHLGKIVSKTDVFVSGSDQIWNVTHRYDPLMFLSFAGDRKKISYATSIGTSEVPIEYAEIVKKHLISYNHISVREETARKCLSKLINRDDIVRVLDPTFLLNPKEWTEFASHSEIEIPRTPYLLCYFVGNNNYEEQLNDVIRKSGVDNILFVLLKGSLPFSVKNAKIIDNASPNDFVSLILNSALLCTDSFHATAIAINFSKPFVELLRFQNSSVKSQNSRIYDLLDNFGMKARLYASKSDKWLMSFDYKQAQEILDKDREFSWKYLKSSLEN